VKVEVKMTGSAKRFNVALVDKLAAGLEVENPHFAKKTDEQTSKDAKPVWIEHQNYRDDRVECFASIIEQSTQYTMEYTARATTPGEFIIPPAHAEEMYTPEIYGQSSSSRMTIY